MSNKNPYTVGFGKIPVQYQSRDIVIDSICDAFESDVPDEQAFKLCGIRGTGKTVTMTSIERKLQEEKDWIVIGVRPDTDIIKDIIAELYSSFKNIAEFIDTNINLSLFGIGVSISGKKPAASMDYALKVLLKELKKKKKRLLVTIDEARKTKGIVNFLQEFQIYIREELPIFLLAAGLYEDIESIENADGITFFLRATKYEMTPLNITNIKKDYAKTLEVSDSEAEKLAVTTKGYAFAYQALGKYMWDSGEKTLTDEVLRKLDAALSEKVYKKIWSELAPNDRYFIRFIAQKDKMSINELLEETKRNHSQWSVPRARLKEKGIINVEYRGEVSVTLPRFKEFVEEQVLLGNV